MESKVTQNTITSPQHLRSPATDLSPPKRSIGFKKRSCCTLHVAQVRSCIPPETLPDSLGNPEHDRGDGNRYNGVLNRRGECT